MSAGLYEGGIKELAAAHCCPTSLPDPDRKVSVDNPFCGDRVDLEIALKDGRVTALAQQVRGCLLCQAAANAVAGSAPGCSAADMEAVLDSLRAMLWGQDASRQWPPGWEQLALFEPVGRYRSRHECVTLPFTALLNALA